MPEPPEKATAGTRGFVTKKVGPLPLWAWAAAAGVAGLSLRLILSPKGARGGPAPVVGGRAPAIGGSAGGGGGAPTRDVASDLTASINDAANRVISAQQGRRSDDLAAQIGNALTDATNTILSGLNTLGSAMSGAIITAGKTVQTVTTTGTTGGGSGGGKGGGSGDVFVPPPKNDVPAPKKDVPAGSPIVIAGADSKLALPGTPLQTINGVTIGLIGNTPIPQSDIDRAIPKANVPSSGVGAVPSGALVSPQFIADVNERAYAVQAVDHPAVLAAENAAAGYDLAKYGGYFGPLNDAGVPVNYKGNP